VTRRRRTGRCPSPREKFWLSWIVQAVPFHSSPSVWSACRSRWSRRRRRLRRTRHAVSEFGRGRYRRRRGTTPTGNERGRVAAPPEAPRRPRPPGRPPAPPPPSPNVRTAASSTLVRGVTGPVHGVRTPRPARTLRIAAPKAKRRPSSSGTPGWPRQGWDAQQAPRRPRRGVVRIAPPPVLARSYERISAWSGCSCQCLVACWPVSCHSSRRGRSRAQSRDPAAAGAQALLAAVARGVTSVTCQVGAGVAHGLLLRRRSDRNRAAARADGPTTHHASGRACRRRAGHAGTDATTRRRTHGQHRATGRCVRARPGRGHPAVNGLSTEQLTFRPTRSPTPSPGWPGTSRGSRTTMSPTSPERSACGTRLGRAVRPSPRPVRHGTATTRSRWPCGGEAHDCSTTSRTSTPPPWPTSHGHRGRARPGDRHPVGPR